MADKSFGIKELNLIGASGTPTITSPNNLNLNASNVAISTDVTIGRHLDVDGHAEFDAVNVSGVSTFSGITTVPGPSLFTNQLSVSGISTFLGAINVNSSYGTSGQVLTSQGSSSAPQWATVNTGTNTDATSLTSTGTVFDFASNTSDIIIITFGAVTLSATTELRLRVGDTTSGTINSGYTYFCVKDGVNNPSSGTTDKFILCTTSNTFGTRSFSGNMTLARAGGSGWSMSFTISTPSNNYLTGSGLLSSAADINRIHLFTSGATLGGYIGAAWY